MKQVLKITLLSIFFSLLCQCMEKAGLSLPTTPSEEIAFILPVNLPPKIIKKIRKECCHVYEKTLTKEQKNSLFPVRKKPRIINYTETMYQPKTGKSQFIFQYHYLPSIIGPWTLHNKKVFVIDNQLYTLPNKKKRRKRQYGNRENLPDLKAHFPDPERHYILGHHPYRPLLLARTGNTWNTLIINKDDKTITKKEIFTDSVHYYFNDSDSMGWFLGHRTALIYCHNWLGGNEKSSPHVRNTLHTINIDNPEKSLQFRNCTNLDRKLDTLYKKNKIELNALVEKIIYNKIITGEYGSYHQESWNSFIQTKDSKPLCQRVEYSSYFPDAVLIIFNIVFTGKKFHGSNPYDYIYKTSFHLPVDFYALYDLPTAMMQLLTAHNQKKYKEFRENCFKPYFYEIRDDSNVYRLDVPDHNTMRRMAINEKEIPEKISVINIYDNFLEQCLLVRDTRNCLADDVKNIDIAVAIISKFNCSVPSTLALNWSTSIEQPTQNEHSEYLFKNLFEKLKDRIKEQMILLATLVPGVPFTITLKNKLKEIISNKAVFPQYTCLARDQKECVAVGEKLLKNSAIIIETVIQNSESYEQVLADWIEKQHENSQPVPTHIYLIVTNGEGRVTEQIFRILRPNIDFVHKIRAQLDAL